MKYRNAVTTAVVVDRGAPPAEAAAVSFKNLYAELALSSGLFQVIMSIFRAWLLYLIMDVRLNRTEQKYLSDFIVSITNMRLVCYEFNV